MTETVTVNADDLRAVLDGFEARDSENLRPVFDRLRAAFPPERPVYARNVVEAVGRALETWTGMSSDAKEHEWVAPELLDALADEGYEVVRSDELLYMEETHVRDMSRIVELAAKNKMLRDTITAMVEECSEVHGIVDDEPAAEQQDAAAETWPDDAAVERALDAYEDTEIAGTKWAQVLAPMRAALVAAGPDRTPLSADEAKANFVAGYREGWNDAADRRDPAVSGVNLLAVDPPPVTEQQDAAAETWPDDAAVERTAEMLWDRFGTDRATPWSTVPELWIRQPWRAWTRELLTAAGPPPSTATAWKDQLAERDERVAQLEALTLGDVVDTIDLPDFHSIEDDDDARDWAHDIVAATLIAVRRSIVGEGGENDV